MSRSWIVKKRIAISWFLAVVIALAVLFSDAQFSATAFGDLLFGIGATMVVIAAFGRFWCSLFISGRKNQCVVMDGPYSSCRHPLYFFTLVALVGIGFCTETVTFPFLVMFVFGSYYYVVMEAEETKLLERFGDIYRTYYLTTSKLIPCKLPPLSDSLNINLRLVTRATIASLFIALSPVLLEVVELLHVTDSLPRLLSVW